MNGHANHHSKGSLVDDFFGNDDFLEEGNTHGESESKAGHNADDYFGERKPAATSRVDRATLERQLRESTLDDDIGGNDFFDDGSWDKALEQAAKSLETTPSGRKTAIGQSAHLRSVAQSQPSPGAVQGGSGPSHVPAMQSFSSSSSTFDPAAKYRDTNEKKVILRVVALFVVVALMIAVSTNSSSPGEEQFKETFRPSPIANNHVKGGAMYGVPRTIPPESGGSSNNPATPPRDQDDSSNEQVGIDSAESKKTASQQGENEKESSIDSQALNVTEDGIDSDSTLTMQSNQIIRMDPQRENDPLSDVTRSSNSQFLTERVGSDAGMSSSHSFSDPGVEGDLVGSASIADSVRSSKKDSHARDFLAKSEGKQVADVEDEDAEVREILQLRTFAQALERIARRGEAAGAHSEVLELLHMPARNAETYVRSVLRSPGQTGLRHPLDPNFREKRERLSRSLEQGLAQYEAVMRADSVARGQASAQRTYKDSRQF